MLEFVQGFVAAYRLSNDGKMPPIPLIKEYLHKYFFEFDGHLPYSVSYFLTEVQSQPDNK